MESTGGASNSLSKWMVALMVGTPLALGVGYMYYNRNNSPKSDKKPSTRKDKKIFHYNAEKQESVDDNSLETNDVTSIKISLKKSERFKKEGNKFFNLGKFDEAISQYNLAIETCPEENTEELATFYQNRAAAYEKLKKFSAVKADCTKALELKPKYIKALIRRSRAMEFCNDLETALEDITVAYFLEKFSNQSTLDTAEKILKQLSLKHTQEHMVTKKPIMPSKHTIATYFSAFYNDPLLSKLNEPSLEENNTSFNKALLRLKKQEYDDVIPLCIEELNNLDSNDNSLHKLEVILLRGTFYFLLGQHQAALADLTTVITNDVSSKELKVNALIKRANINFQLQNLNKSFEDFTEAEKIDPQCGDIYHNRGQINFLLENRDEAKSDFEKSVERNPGFCITYVQKCYTDYIYAKLKSEMTLMNNVMNSFKEAFEKFPECAEGYALYAQLLVLNNQFEKADSYFLEASKRDPKNATIYVHRGLLQMNWKNDIEKAVELIKKAIELDDKCEYAYDMLGTIEIRRGHAKDAIALFDKAILLARNATEISHIFYLRNLTKSQIIVSERLGRDITKYLHQML